MPHNGSTPPRAEPTTNTSSHATGAVESDFTHRWTFLSNHAHVLILLAADSTIVLREVADQVGITERAVQRIVADLEEAGFLERERVGRRNQYRIHADQSLRHPIESHCSLADLLNLVIHRPEAVATSPIEA